MKICHMTSAHDSNDSRIFQKECVSMAKEPDFDVYLVAPGKSREEQNVKVIGVGERPSSRLKRMLTFSKVVYNKSLELDADIYHFHDPELLGAGLKLKKKGKIVIFDSHENTVEQIKIKKYIPALMRNFVAKVFDMYEGYVCKRIDAVIFPCLFDGKNPFEKKSKQTVFINNLPYLSEFPKLEKKSSVYDVCVIGSLTEERGITNLLKACKLAGVKLALGGDFSPESYGAQLREEGLLEGVDCLGFCDRDKVVDTYAKSKFGISNLLAVGQYPRAHNLPTKVYEYMAMKMPVIISNFAYPMEVMETYKFGITVDPSDVNAIADCMKQILSDEEMSRVMGEEGRRAIEEVFNWEAESEKIKNLYIETYRKKK